MKSLPMWTGAAVTLFVAVIYAYGQDKRAIVCADCVGIKDLTRELGNLEINGQGTKVAYLLRAPNISTNQVDIKLEVLDLADKRGSSRELLAGVEISHIHWLADGKSLTCLLRDEGHAALAEVDAVSGTRQIIARMDTDITEYSATDDASTVVVAIDPASQTSHMTALTHSAIDNARGYYIPYQSSAAYRRRQLFLMKKAADGHWMKPQMLTFTSPIDGRAMDKILPVNGELFLSLSPNGESLFFVHDFGDAGEDLPTTWKDNPQMMRRREAGAPMSVPLVTNLLNGVTKIAIDTPMVFTPPVWSPDSKAFAIASGALIGEEADNLSEPIQLLAVSVASGAITKVISTERGLKYAPVPLSWGDNLVVQTDANRVTMFKLQQGTLQNESEVALPLQEFYPLGFMASDGHVVVGDYQTPTMPPELFLYDLKSQTLTTLVKFNPQFDTLSISPVKELQWQTSDGSVMHGLLVMPRDYVHGQRYPLVIQVMPTYGQFLCDGGYWDYPSEAPQPIASAGMMYLLRTNRNPRQEESHYPKGYPGGIGEAAFVTDIWDSAVKTLTQQGLIDPTRVGVIGFSRSGFYVEYMLAHAQTHFLAATLTDNIVYGMTEYWLDSVDSMIEGSNAMYGGPPYGATLKNWLAYSVSFNIDKFHTPVLMEEMGYGRNYDDREAPPLTLATRMDVFNGLNYLQKPVELYFYPHEGHEPEHPQARLASLQRNVDWYRFWLQGYERPNPEDPDQYKRWEHLRDLRDADYRVAKMPLPDSTEQPKDAMPQE